MTRKRKRSKQPSQVPPLDERHYAAIELMIRPFYDSKSGGNRWLTRTEIAEIIGISRMQLYRWEQRKDFQREKSKRFNAYWRRSSPKVQTYASLAIGGDARAFATIMSACMG